jgi:hypothetical protein
MAYEAYVAHLDRQIREDLNNATNVLPVAWISDTVVRWPGIERYVTCRRDGDTRVQFLFQIAAEPFAYDRFGDDLIEPDITSTARKISEFLNGAPVEETE